MEFPSQRAAREECDLWKWRLPEVAPAHLQCPGDQLPPGAVPALMLGSLIAVGAATVAGSLLALLTTIPLRAGMNPETQFLSLAACVVALVPALLMFLTIGGVAGLVVAQTSNRIGNRHRGVAAVFAVTAALLTMPGTIGVFRAFMRSVDTSLVLTSAEITLSTLLVDCFLFGVVIAAATAAFVTRRFVHGMSTCQVCHVPLDRWRGRSMPPQILRDLLEALRLGQFADAAQLLRVGEGGMATPVYHTCPKCGVGFIDIEVEFSGQWPGDSGRAETLAERWLCHSREYEAKDFQVIIGRG